MPCFDAVYESKPNTLCHNKAQRAREHMLNKKSPRTHASIAAESQPAESSVGIMSRQRSQSLHNQIPDTRYLLSTDGDGAYRWRIARTEQLITSLVYITWEILRTGQKLKGIQRGPLDSRVRDDYISAKKLVTRPTWLEHTMHSRAYSKVRGKAYSKSAQQSVQWSVW